MVLPDRARGMLNPVEHADRRAGCEHSLSGLSECPVLLNKFAKWCSLLSGFGTVRVAASQVFC